MSASAQRLRQLFDKALTLEGRSRSAWLARMRTREPALAARIERMLAMDAQRVDPFAHAIDTLKQSLDFDATRWVGQTIGVFRILRLLGQGGMSAVFLAERQRRGFRQLVALKVLRGCAFADADIARFASERDILARLHHPNIALFIDAGATDGGWPFLAMEYVEGVPLFAYCDQHRMSVHARLRLVRGLLAALAYAHGALVVHRDLKPDNMLVTADGTPKLLDFGIARLIDTEASGGSNTTRVFTPAYASPEQLAGDPVATASDIYSLGLVLYELCTGALPWDRDARPLSTTAPPVEPSRRLRQLDSTRCAAIAARRGTHALRLAGELRGDLGRILTRCLEPEPACRYVTVHELEVDLTALLKRRPPPGVQVPHHARMLAFVRRHAWPLALTSLLVAAGATVLVQSLSSQQRLQAQRDRAVAAAEQARIEAAKSAQIADFVRSMLASIDPDRAKDMDRSLMRLVLDSAARRADRELAGQPTVHLAIERTIAASYNAIGEYKLAVHHFDTALTLAQRLGKVAAQVDAGVRKARAMGNLGHTVQALDGVTRALQWATALPPDARARLFAQSTLAGLTCDTGDFATCRKRYARVLAIQKRVLGEADPDTNESLVGLARANAALGAYGAAETMYARVIARYRQQYGKADSHTLRAINGLAITYLKAGRYADAEKLLRPAVALARETWGKDHPVTLGMYSNLGGAIRQQPGGNAAARPYYEHFLAVMRAKHGPDGRRTVIAEVNLALLLRDAGKLDRAANHARTAVAHMQTAFGQGSPYSAIVLADYASILIRQGHYHPARQALERARDLLASRKGYGPDHPTVQKIADLYVRLHEATGRAQPGAHRRALQTGAHSPRTNAGAD